jgi:p-hydroxybenzoate 3-monooxygenase
VRLLEQVGVAERMHSDGLVHEGFSLAVDGERFRIDLKALTGGASVMVYGQTEVTKDLIVAAQARGTPVVFEAEGVALHDLESARPYVTYRSGGESHRLDCDFVAGCDGFHGVARTAMPADLLKTYERVYPFGWLGILADVAPCDHELIYSNHVRGFALASMRSTTRSRYYVQAPLDTDLADWPDERIWDELAERLGPQAAANLQRGPSIEKSIAPLRSFVAEPMRFGRLFLAGDAAHIVPPTGAKGLNLAMADVTRLARAVTRFFKDGDEAGLDEYSSRGLTRTWRAQRFSWWMTSMLHKQEPENPFDYRRQLAELEYLVSSTAAMTSLAENYVGSPLD